MVEKLISVSNVIYSIFSDLRIITIGGKDAALLANILDRLASCQQEVELVKSEMEKAEALAASVAGETEDVGDVK